MPCLHASLNPHNPNSQNANYWYAAASAQNHPIGPKLLAAATKAAGQDLQLQTFVSNQGGVWQPSRFVSLCQKAYSSKDPTTLRFCQQVMQAEWRSLMDHCYAQL